MWSRKEKKNCREESLTDVDSCGAEGRQLQLPTYKENLLCALSVLYLGPQRSGLSGGG